MHDLTMHELDAQLAEQLPARELMQATAVAIGALAANFANVSQSNSAVVSGNHNTVDQYNSSYISQYASAFNSGSVSATASG